MSTFPGCRWFVEEPIKPYTNWLKEAKELRPSRPQEVSPSFASLQDGVSAPPSGWVIPLLLQLLPPTLAASGRVVCPYTPIQFTTPSTKKGATYSLCRHNSKRAAGSGSRLPTTRISLTFLPTSRKMPYRRR